MCPVPGKKRQQGKPPSGEGPGESVRLTTHDGCRPSPERADASFLDLSLERDRPERRIRVSLAACDAAARGMHRVARAMCCSGARRDLETQRGERRATKPRATRTSMASRHRYAPLRHDARRMRERERA